MRWDDNNHWNGGGGINPGDLLNDDNVQPNNNRTSERDDQTPFDEPGGIFADEHPYPN
jgi:hypothetical protein